MMPILEQHNISPAQLSQTFITALHSSGISPTDDLYKYKYERSSQGYSELALSPSEFLKWTRPSFDLDTSILVNRGISHKFRTE